MADAFLVCDMTCIACSINSSSDHQLPHPKDHDHDVSNLLSNAFIISGL